MNANMYQHQIDECLERAYAELETAQKFRRSEYAEHVRRRINSLKRLREGAKKACFNPKPQDEVYERKTLEQLLKEFKPY